MIVFEIKLGKKKEGKRHFRKTTQRKLFLNEVTVKCKTLKT